MTTNAADDKYAPTTWGQKVDNEFDQVLPSGQLCRLKTLQMSDVIRLNIVNEVDFISTKFNEDDVDEAANKQKSDQDAGVDFLKQLGGPDFNRLEQTINKVTLACVVAPSIAPAPIGKTKRKAGVVYVDTIDFIDRMTIFTICFRGLGDMNAFRAESQDGVGNLDASESAEVSA